MEIPVEIDYSRTFAGCAPDAWEAEYLANVVDEDHLCSQPLRESEAAPGREAAVPFDEEPVGHAVPEDWYDQWYKYVDESAEIRDFARQSELEDKYEHSRD